MKNLVIGTKLQFDLDDLAVIGKNSNGIVLSYKQGLKALIEINNKEDLDKQFELYCKLQQQYHANKNGELYHIPKD